MSEPNDLQIIQEQAHLISALKAEVAELKNRLQVGDLGAANHLAAIEAENDRLRAALEWHAQTVHESRHQTEEGTFRDCRMKTCKAARAALGRKS